MADHISKCSRCGCREFTVVETLDWRGEVDDAGLLDCTNAWNEIDSIRCADCRVPYATDNFAGIDFN
jgi:hypothetical protein